MAVGTKFDDKWPPSMIFAGNRWLWTSHSLFECYSHIAVRFMIKKRENSRICFLLFLLLGQSFFDGLYWTLPIFYHFMWKQNAEIIRFICRPCFFKYNNNKFICFSCWPKLLVGARRATKFEQFCWSLVNPFFMTSQK